MFINETLLIFDCSDQYTVNAKRVEVAVKKVVNGAHPSTLNTR